MGALGLSLCVECSEKRVLVLRVLSRLLQVSVSRGSLMACYLASVIWQQTVHKQPPPKPSQIPTRRFANQARYLSGSFKLLCGSFETPPVNGKPQPLVLPNRPQHRNLLSETGDLLRSVCVFIITR